ncbi:hypothetical protein ANN_18064 [Periplaneta americana]|uniref:Per a allergen n=1 Tax=Periplaneta americana TaxID=6978 RepID=A0ABQ8SMP6_PERAM|nr:hypothetical protein ANN_18064 [Periplaneta americana]
MAGLCKGGNEPPGFLKAKINIYLPTVDYFKAKHQLENIEVIGLLIGARGVIPKFFESFRKAFELREWMRMVRKGEGKTRCRHVAYSCRITPRGPPGLTSPFDRRITINSDTCLPFEQGIVAPHGKAPCKADLSNFKGKIVPGPGIDTREPYPKD